MVNNNIKITPPNSAYLEKSKKYKGYHYSVLKPEMIDYLHTQTLKMTEVVIKLFQENNIRYMICGGTLLGAYTTNKFIPWDDDVNICVLEEDYDKMLSILLSSMPNWMVLQCEKTDPNYYHGWVKVRDKASIVYPNEPNYQFNGVWLDLYKLTLTKKKEVPYLIVKEHLDYLERRLSHGCISEDEYCKRISDNNLIERLEHERIKMEHNIDDSDIYTIWSASKIQVDKEWCFPTKSYQFEGLELESFNNPDAYLVRHYGENFMTLPPEEMRRVGINKIEYK